MNRTICAFVPCLLRTMLLLALCLPALPGRAEEALEAMPERLSLGVVRVGSVVEAGTVILLDDQNDATGIACKVTPPPFARLVSSAFANAANGSTSPGLVFEISVSVDTAKAGKFSGPLKVELGSRKISIPMDVTVLAKEPALPRVLVCEPPFRPFTGDGNNPLNLDGWRELVRSGKFSMNYLLANRLQADASTCFVDHKRFALNDYDVVVLSAGGLIYLSSDCMEALWRYVENGGRLVVSADTFMKGSVKQANRILKPFGMQMRNVEPGVEPGEGVQVATRTAITKHSLTENVTTLRFWRPSPVTITPNSKAQLLVSVPCFPEEGVIAVAPAGKGEVVVIGQSLLYAWINPIFPSPENEEHLDNARSFVRNLFSWKQPSTPRIDPP